MTGDEQAVFHDYSEDFFDFIVIDECHRGGAKDESTWRAILEYFSPAVQLGLTATPKRTHNADTYDYFGEPVYEYSLRDGIEDGFLTPFKVNQIASTMDEYQWEEGDDVISGDLDPEKTYTEAEMNRRIVIEEQREAGFKSSLAVQILDRRQSSFVRLKVMRHLCETLSTKSRCLMTQTIAIGLLQTMGRWVNNTCATSRITKRVYQRS